MLEKEVENNICRYAESKGLVAEKFASPNKRAVPDRLITGGNALIFFMELKATGKAKGVHKDATGHEGRQWRDHQRRRAQGFRVYVVDDITVGEQIIDYEIANATQELPD